MTRTRKAGADPDRAMLSDILDETGSGAGPDAPRPDKDAASEREKHQRQSKHDPAKQGVAAGVPEFSDLANELTRDEFDGAFTDMLDTGEERDPDSFDDSLFYEPDTNVPERSTPDTSSPIRRFAGAWQGRRSRATVASETPPQDPPADDRLEKVLANSNIAPLAAPPPDNMLDQADPGKEGLTQTPSASEEAASARSKLAFALAFSNEDDALEEVLSSGGNNAEPDALDDLFAADLFDEDLLDAVLNDAEPTAADSPGSPPASTDPSSDLLAATKEHDQDEKWIDDLDIAMDDVWGEPEYDDKADPGEDAPDRSDPAMAAAIPEHATEPQDGIDGLTQAPAVVAMQNLVGEDLLAEVLRDDTDDDLASQVANRSPETVPVTPPAPDPEPRRKPRQRGGMDELDHVLQAGAARRAPTRKWLVRLIWLVLLGGLLYVAFLPYRFEVGGEFVIRPFDKAEARARTSGEITTLHAREGDWVEAGEVIAVLSNWNQTRDVALIKSEGERLQAQLATLTDGARAEEITVAEQDLARAEVQLAMREQELQRQETLFARGTIAQKVLEDARIAYQLAQSERDQATAALALVKAGPRDSEVDALRATIAGNAEQLAFAELMLEYTNIRAPVSGQIVSSMADVPVGHSLSVGGLLAEIEDNRTMIAELAVPEITIEEVTVGAPVELRLWSNSDDVITGTVNSIAPRAEERDFGWIIRVLVEVPNPDGKLAANVTGFGKIEAEERPVWQAFSRAIQRFFVIEVWSWLP